MNNKKLNKNYTFPYSYNTLNNYKDRLSRILFTIDENILIFNDGIFHVVPYAIKNNNIVFNINYNIIHLDVFETFGNFIYKNKILKFLNLIELDENIKNKIIDYLNNIESEKLGIIDFCILISEIKYTNVRKFKKDLVIFNKIFLLDYLTRKEYLFYTIMYSKFSNKNLVYFKFNRK